MAMRKPQELKGQLKNALEAKESEPSPIAKAVVAKRNSLRQPVRKPPVKASGDYTLPNERVRPIAKEIPGNLKARRKMGHFRGHHMTPAQRRMFMNAARKRLSAGSSFRKPIPGKPVKTA